MRNFEIEPNMNAQDLVKHKTELEDELVKETLTPRQIDRIRKKLAYISFELSMQADDGTSL